MSEPLVSVICTAKNAAATISETMVSILGQDMVDWELIVVDDGSADQTPEIVAQLTAGDHRVRLIRTSGIGRGPALNLALRHARASLIANTDADDVSHPSRLSAQLGLARKHPEFAVLATRAVHVYEAAEVRWPDAAYAELPAVVDVTRRLAIHNPVCHSSVLMRRDALMAVEGYSEDRRSQFDYDLWIRLAAHGEMIGRIDAALLAKRLHARQAFDRTNRPRYLLSSAALQMRAIRVLEAPVHRMLLVPIRVAWGLLPRDLRRSMRRVGGK